MNGWVSYLSYARAASASSLYSPRFSTFPFTPIAAFHAWRSQHTPDTTTARLIRRQYQAWRCCSWRGLFMIRVDCSPLYFDVFIVGRARGELPPTRLTGPGGPCTNKHPSARHSFPLPGNVPPCPPLEPQDSRRLACGLLGLCSSTRVVQRLTPRLPPALLETLKYPFTLTSLESGQDAPQEREWSGNGLRIPPCHEVPGWHPGATVLPDRSHHRHR